MKPLQTLVNPDRCKVCGGLGRVIDSRMRVGYRRRVHRCGACKRTWESFQSTIHPRRALEALSASM